MSDAKGCEIVARNALAKNSTGSTVISLKVTLRGAKPLIWRRLLMPGTMTLGDVHQAIQAAMGWEDSHLHAFDIDGRQYGDRHSVDDVADEKRLTLNAVVKSGITRFAYTYDFGDNWEHTVATFPSAPARNHARFRPHGNRSAVHRFL
jgi:hypothetical protein